MKMKFQEGQYNVVVQLNNEQLDYITDKSSKALSKNDIDVLAKIGRIFIEGGLQGITPIKD